MKTPTLDNICNIGVIDSALRTSLNQLMKTDGDTAVSFSWPGWDTADFIQKISGEVSSAMYQKGKDLGDRGFKKFNSGQTKLTEEMINEIWLVASKKIGEKMFESFKGSEIDEIPGLEHAISEGGIIAKGGSSASPEAHGQARERLLSRASQVKFDREMLIRDFRNRFFEYMKKEFKLFENDEPEHELKMPIK